MNSCHEAALNGKPLPALCLTRHGDWMERNHDRLQREQHLRYLSRACPVQYGPPRALPPLRQGADNGRKVGGVDAVEERSMHRRFKPMGAPQAAMRPP
eukprot:21691-Eustigmatos_ZCMA.PRE.1